MTGVLAIMAGGRGYVELDVAASNVSRTRSGATSDGTVTTVALPNTTATGGVAPYTYAWLLTSGDTPPTISDATSQNPTWSALVTSGTPIVTVWGVTVTDAVGATASTDITVTLTWVQI